MTIQSLHSFKYENSKIIFPFSSKWIMLLFSLVAIACTNEKTLNEKINTLYSTPIVFPESGLLRVDGSSIVPYQEKLSESRYNMVVFHSQIECTVCALEKMSDWNALLNWERDGKGKLTLYFLLHRINLMKLFLHTEDLDLNTKSSLTHVAFSSKKTRTYQRKGPFTHFF